MSLPCAPSREPPPLTPPSVSVYIVVTFVHYPGFWLPAVLLCDLPAALPRMGPFIRAKEHGWNTHTHACTLNHMTNHFSPGKNHIWIWPCPFHNRAFMQVHPLTLWAPPQSPWRSNRSSGRSSCGRRNQAPGSLFQTQSRRSRWSTAPYHPEERERGTGHGCEGERKGDLEVWEYFHEYVSTWKWIRVHLLFY